MTVFALTILAYDAEPTRSFFEHREHGTEHCLETFDTFAHRLMLERSDVLALPGPPWQTVDALPEVLQDSSTIFSQMAATREVGDDVEVWVSGFANNEPVFALYRVNTRDWEIIPRTLDDPALSIDELFVMRDGAIWGQVTLTATPAAQSVPVLSRFNESIRRFVTPRSMMRFNVPDEQIYYYGLWVPPWPLIRSDTVNGLWIIVHFDGVYFLDARNGSIDRIVPFSDRAFRDAAADSQGNLVVATYPHPDFTKTTADLFSITPDMLWWINRVNLDIVALDRPVLRWPGFRGMALADRGRLWLGSTGFREGDGRWRLIHADPVSYFAHAGEESTIAPRLMLESSDGRLWFRKSLDAGPSVEGTAWYDPQSGAGCMFTNYPAIVMEDSYQRLWLVANHRLYGYELND